MDRVKAVKKAKGFTLIELVIVIVIIGILATVSVPIYRGYTRRAMSSEGRALCGSVASAEKLYFSEHGVYLTVAATSNNATLMVDARQNRYFNSYAVTQSGTAAAGTATFTITVTGTTADSSGITITYVQPANGSPTVTETGL